MSKLGVVFCAAAFFVFARAVILETVDYNAVKNEIDHAREQIYHKSEEIRKQVLAIGPLPNRIHYRIIREFKRNIKEIIADARFEIDQIFTKTKNSLSKEHCRSFFVDFETAGQDVKANVQRHIYKELFTVVVSFSNDMEITSTKAQGQLTNLVPKAKKCHGAECLDLKKYASTILSEFRANATEIFNNYKAMADESNFRKLVKQTIEYENFIEKEHKLIEETDKCLTSSRR